MKRSVIFLMVISLFAAVAAEAQKKASFYTVGKYTGMTPSSKPYMELEGIDVYLAQSADETFALVTRATGQRGVPVLVPVKTSGKDMRSIAFSIEDKKLGSIDLEGTVTAEGIKLRKGEAAVGLEAGTLLKRECGGTFSDISMSKGGDYSGMEVYLVDGGWRWWALVTTAEGMLDTPILVEAKVTGKNFEKVELTLPGNRDGRVMKGTISAKNTLTLRDIDGMKTVLRSKCYK